MIGPFKLYQEALKYLGHGLTHLYNGRGKYFKRHDGVFCIQYVNAGNTELKEGWWIAIL